MTLAITFKRTTRAVRVRRDEFDANHTHVRCVTVTAWVGTELAGTLTAYLLDIDGAYHKAGGSLEEVGQLLQVADEIDSLCCFAYGSHSMDLTEHYHPKRQRVFATSFRHAVAELGYVKPNWVQLISGHTDFNRRLLYLSRISVEQNFRRLGIGSMMIQKLGHYRHSVDYIVLMAMPFQADFSPNGGDDYDLEVGKVDAFYKSLGFVHKKGTRWMLNTPLRLHAIKGKHDKRQAPSKAA